MSYKEVEALDIAFLRGVCGEENVLAGDAISVDYSRDEMTPEDMRCMPDVLVKAASTSQVSEILKYANERRIPVTPRGQGTGLVMGAVAIHRGIMLDLTRMNKILELDEDNMTLVVEPGVLIMEVRAFAEEHGLYYPPMPGEKSASIGGNVSTNAGGMTAVKYGVTRDYVRGLEVVIPGGEVIEIEGKVAKNSSGYSLKNLIIGSEGTLAVVTKIVLRLVALPKRTVSLLVPFSDPVTAIKTVPRIMKDKVLPVAVEFMEGDVIKAAEEYLGKKFPDHSAEAYLLLSFDGATKEQVQRDYEVVAQLCLASGAADVFISDTQERQDAIWSARGAFLEGIKASTTEMDECDVVVPISKIAEFLKRKVELEKKNGLRIRSFAHAGDGNLHVYILKDAIDEKAWKVKLGAIMQSLYDKARELGGQVSGEHGIGFMKKSYLAESAGPVAIELMRGIKKVFDPNNILNPGKVI
ncbi:MAG: FAD-binding protein [Candidatus Lokiarchaeota archaeon]|nr:FAD-binding protein [Candidatus Lokiarchaeota archaeon]